MYRTLKNELKYSRQRKIATGCPFCAANPKEIVREEKYFRIFLNIFGYDIWDRHQVSRHLMLIPKDHITSLKKMSKAAAMEYFQLMSEYVDTGFNCFTRPNSSKTKSQTHFHTHLIQTSDKLYNELSFTAEPYKLKFK